MIYERKPGNMYINGEGTAVKILAYRNNDETVWSPSLLHVAYNQTFKVSEEKAYKCVIFVGNFSSLSQSRSLMRLFRHVTLNSSRSTWSRDLTSLVTCGTGVLGRRRLATTGHEQFNGQNRISLTYNEHNNKGVK